MLALCQIRTITIIEITTTMIITTKEITKTIITEIITTMKTEIITVNSYQIFLCKTKNYNAICFAIVVLSFQTDLIILISLHTLM